MAVVRVLPAKSESAVLDSHEERDLPVLEVSLMMSECFKGGRCFDDGCW